MASRDGDLPRAAELLGLGGELDELRVILPNITYTDRMRVAARLARRGLDAAAALAWESAGALELAERGFVRARELRSAARVALARGDEHAAAGHLRARLTIAPDDGEASLTLASLQLALGQPAAAAATASVVESASPLRRRATALVDEALGTTDAPRGRYVELVEVATSPVARVLRGRDSVTGREIAVKVLRAPCGADARRRLAAEARAQASLRHPHVVPLLEVDERSGMLVTPWMSGGSLKDALASGPLVAARVAEIGASIADALASAHGRGLVHRDVTAANVLFDEVGAAYLADFGAAHARDDAATVTAGLAGTLATMALEVRRGEPASPASDVYSLGRVLWRALTGEDEDRRAPSELGLGLGAEHDALFEALSFDDPARRPDAAHTRDRLLTLAWPARAAARRTRPDTPATLGDRDALARATIAVPRTAATLEAARVVVAGCEAGLAALPTIRGLDAAHVLIERVVADATPGPRASDAADEATRYLAERGMASVTLDAGQRGLVVVPSALMPR